MKKIRRVLRVSIVLPEIDCTNDRGHVERGVSNFTLPDLKGTFTVFFKKKKCIVRIAAYFFL